MTFLERAAILTERGVPIAPALPGDKRCVLAGWPERATTDLLKIQEWAKVDDTANTAAVCLSDGVCVLDADNAQLAELVLPLLPAPTFTVLSGGKGLPHFYFRHTPESTAFGNCKVMRDGVLWADLQANRKYVIGPMSELAKGGVYRIACDAEIQPMPSSLLEWIKTNGIQQKPIGVTPTVRGTELDENFDFDAFLKHFGLHGGGWNGHWYVLPYCPIYGFPHDAPHNGSRPTGIYFDGNRLGWHCFASSCPGNRMSFGQVLRHLNATSDTPYRAPIWKDDSDKWLKHWNRKAVTV